MSQELLTGTGSSTSTAMPEAEAATLSSATFMLADESAPTLADSVVMPAPSTPFSRELLFTPVTPEHSDIRQTPQNLAFEEVASRGGQATIFKAHTPSGTPVAVKVFENSEECLLEWRSLKKFSNFRVLPNALAHGTVCMPHAVGTQEKSCIVEEWLDGDTLAKHLRRTGRSMTVEETLSTMSPVIAFLATAETELRVGVIHHDVKPSNILLDSTGCVRLIDFGIAQTSRDQARLAWGTQGFSSPVSYTHLDVYKRQFFAIPVCLALIVASLRVLPNHNVEDSTPLDIPGSVLLVVTVLLFLFAVQHIDVQHVGQSLASAEVLAPALGFVASLAAFVLAERRAKSPVFHLEYLGNKPIVITMVAVSYTHLGMTRPMLAAGLPISFFEAEGETDMRAGPSGRVIFLRNRFIS